MLMGFGSIGALADTSNADAEFIESTYRELWGVEAGAEGLRVWLPHIAQHGREPFLQAMRAAPQHAEHLARIAAAIDVSADAAAETLVRSFYREYLNKAPDAEGLAFWIREYQLYGRQKLVDSFEAESGRVGEAARVATEADAAELDSDVLETARGDNGGDFITSLSRNVLWLLGGGAFVLYLIFSSSDTAGSKK